MPTFSPCSASQRLLPMVLSGIAGTLSACAPCCVAEMIGPIPGMLTAARETGLSGCVSVLMIVRPMSTGAPATP